jgi:hypothetical protein
MKTLIALIAFLAAATATAALNAYLKLDASTEAQATELAKKGYDYYKSRGAKIVRADPAAPRSSDKRKQSLYFPETMHGFYLTPDNEVLNIRKGKLVKRMKVRPLIDKVAVPRAKKLPEVDDEVLVNAKDRKEERKR